ncbi:hypothetical protein SERLA73DRAFT_138094, partial [Serpula lacrymans var. lacrymans S7.3]
YHSLSKDEKQKLLEDYLAHADNKKNGFRITAKSQINDVTHTLKMIEQEVRHHPTRKWR